MRIKASIVFPLILLCLSGSLIAQNWSGILAPSRAIDWSTAGIAGGIPNRTTSCSTVNASTYGNGSSDATSGIQAALNACPSGQVVTLSAGTFRINSSLTVPSNVTLRGTGAHNTVLDAHGSATGVVNLGSGGSVSASNSTTITGGATAGSTSITVSSASGVSVGTYLMITELNDSSYVTITGNQGACTWCDASMWNGTRARGQIVEVTSVNGTTIGISPLYSAFRLTPLATRFSAGAKYAGVEDLQVYANNTGYTTNFLMTGCAYCWLKGVEGNFADGDHVEAFNSYHCEIRDSYFHDGYSHTSGTTDNDIFIVNKTSGFLIENNILTRLHASIMLNWGAAGNVIAYNFFDGNYDTTAPNVLIYDLATHGAHPQFNLWEGNIGPSFHMDSIWGSSSHGTAFRNWTTGTTQICNPMSARGAAGSCHPASQANRATGINYESLYYNLVGNVAGSSAVKSMSEVALAIGPDNRSYSGTAYDMDFGYGDSGDGGSEHCSSHATCASYTTAFIHGVYTDANSSVIWDAAHSDHTLPASFFHSAKPAWWGSSPWPAIGPDVTGGTGPGGHTYPNPAQACYANTTKDGNGFLVFNASTCYGQSSGGSQGPTPPTSVKAVVH